MLAAGNVVREAGPVRRDETPDGAAVWVVSRYREVREALADPRLSLDKAHSTGGYRGFSLPPALDANLLNLDPPDHTRLRRLAATAFTRTRVAALRASTERATDTLLSTMDGVDSVDLMAALAVPLPLTVIGDLLGVPVENRARFRAWTDTLVAPDPARPEATRAALGGMLAFLTGLIAAKRAAPADDLLSGLVAARDADDRLSEEELVSLAFLLLWAGYENSVHLIGNAVLDRLTGRTGGGAALEDLIAAADPNPYAIRRFPLGDLRIGGVDIPAGDTVLLCIAAANGDPARGGDPHLTFGHGPHYCLGAPLARLEAETVLGRLLARFPHLRLAVPVGELRWRPSWRSRGLLALPVHPGPAAG